MKQDRYVQIIFSVFVLIGLFGSVWISDDYDDVRTVLLCFFAIPYLTLWVLWQKYWAWPLREFPNTTRFLFAAMLLCFAWGHFLLLNTLSDDPSAVKRTFSLNHSTITMTYYEGAFGHNYTTRW